MKVTKQKGTRDIYLDDIKISDIKKQYPDIKFYIIKDCYKFAEIMNIINSL